MRKIKIFLTMLAIAGVLFATSSCVDDSESASVTKIRDSKAAQLQAQADLNKAEATLRQAQAAAEAVKAEADKLRAEGEKAVNDAKAAQTLSQTEIEKAKADELLKQTIAEVAFQVAEQEGKLQKLGYTLQAELLEFKAKAAIALSTADALIKSEVALLLIDYNSVLSTLNGVKDSIARKSLDLVKEELALATYKYDSTYFVDEHIVTTKRNILIEEETIEASLASIAEWNAFKVNPDVGKEITAKKAELEKVKDTLDDYYKVYQNLDKIAVAAETKYTDTILPQIQKYEAVVRGSFEYVRVGITWTSPNNKITIGSIEFTHKPNATEKRTFGAITYYLSGYHPSYNNIYSARIPANGGNPERWDFISIQTSIGTTPYYASVEEYKVEKASLEEERLEALEVVQLYSRQVDSLSKQLAGLEKKESDAEKAEQEAFDAYIAGLAAFGVSAKGPGDTVDIQELRELYDGQNFAVGAAIAVNGSTVNVPTANGGAKGAHDLAQIAYKDAIGKINQAKVSISGALTTYYNKVSDIAKYDEVIETLSVGSYVDLKIKEKEAEYDAIVKRDAADKAEDAYNKISIKTKTLSKRIEDLEKIEWEGVLNDGNGQYSYEQESAKAIAKAIEDLEIDIKKAEAKIKGYENELLNIAYYAQDPSATTLDKAVVYVIAAKKQKIAKLAAEIDELVYKETILEGEKESLKSLIDGLLSVKLEE